MDEYRFGYSAAEFERLLQQHRIWQPATDEHLQAGKIQPGDIVLDLGCGPGFVSIDMVSRGASIMALDRDPGSLSALRSRGLENVEVLPPTHLPDLPEFPRQPTAAYMRWVLCYLGAADTETLFRTLFDRLLPGGRLLIHDYMNYRSARLEPASNAVQDVINTFHGQLADADIGSALPDILARCGFEISWKRIVSMTIKSTDDAWSWPDQFFRLHVPPLENSKPFMNDWASAAKNPEAVFHSWPVIQIVAEKVWQREAERNTKAEFVFLSVDVIGHSKLYADQPSNMRLASIHRALSKLRKFTTECLGPAYQPYMLWDWASDGGIFGFPSSRIDLNTTETVLKRAIRIWKELPDFNAERIAVGDLKDGFALHISLDRGDAYYDADPTMRRGDALNVAAKLKSPSGHTEILITERIFKDLPKNYENDFVVISRVESQQPIYGYLPALERAMDELGKEHLKSHQFVEASQCFYRLGRFYLAAKKPKNAERAFERAADALEKTPENIRHRYFFYAFREYYKAWLRLIRDSGIDIREAYQHKETFLHDGSPFRVLFESSDWRDCGRLVTHFDFIFNQADILCDKMVNTPAGLSTLEVALLLERMGYSPRLFGDALTKRLDRVDTEIAQNHHRSIDGDCSMCTGIAVSAFVLGHRQDHADVLIDWLKLLKPVRFCWLRRETDADPHQHSLHYAAAVLQGFLDYADLKLADPEPIVEEFFRPTEQTIQGFPTDWMRHRNTDVFEVCTYILPVFTRYLLAGYTLKEDQKRTLGAAISALAKNLFDETKAAETSATPGNLDSAKENLGSLTLGLLIGMNDTARQIMEDVQRRFDNRAKSLDIARSSRTLDSSLERTRRYLEGLLLYWEVSLRREAGGAGI
ncbi:MAG TPA: methyltransferase domain-containing protein [Thermoanaerobaculia bacterium]|jgi:SAM-dependent methyltransferase